MKDDQDKFIHIGDLVTLTTAARPRWLQGRLAKVLSLGENTIKINVITRTIFGEDKVRYIVPSMVRVGNHEIIPLWADDIETREQISMMADRTIMWKLKDMVEDGIITAQQADEIREHLEIIK